MNWDECHKLTMDINNHYGMMEHQYKLIYEMAEKLPKHPTILELGVCHGKTAAILAYIANNLEGEYSGIDNFGLEGSAQEVQEMFLAKGLIGNIIDANTHDYPWDQSLDLLFIDAGHDEANVKGDCEKYLPFVKSGGIVIFDDWEEPFEPSSPHWAVHHYGYLHTSEWEEVEYFQGLMVRKKP